MYSSDKQPNFPIWRNGDYAPAVVAIESAAPQVNYCIDTVDMNYWSGSAGSHRKWTLQLLEGTTVVDLTFDEVRVRSF